MHRRPVAGLQRPLPTRLCVKTLGHGAASMADTGLCWNNAGGRRQTGHLRETERKRTSVEMLIKVPLRVCSPYRWAEPTQLERGVGLYVCA